LVEWVCGIYTKETMINLINLITPCSRPDNLEKISKSINIPRDKYRWLVCYDSKDYPDWKLLPFNCEFYCLKDERSISGNAQRNLCLDLSQSLWEPIEESYIYFLDDDITVHPLLWENIKNLSNDFISFSQENKDGSLRLKGDKVMLNHIDSHNFLFKGSLLGNSRWALDRRDADGLFAYEIYQKAKNPIFIDKVLSTYNSLR